MDTEALVRSLEKKRYTVSCFATGKEAAAYLEAELSGCSVGFGDSATIAAMGLFEKLSVRNTVYDPAQAGDDNERFLDIAKQCLTTDVFLTSVNAMTEAGEMVNIDGTGNRVAASLFGHKKVYFIVSLSKVESTLEAAIHRARNEAGPKNASRLKLRTPCAVTGDRCYDCASPDRICNSLTVYLRKMNDVEDTEVILIEEKLGF